MRLLPLLGFAFLSTGLLAQSTAAPSATTPAQGQALAVPQAQRATVQSWPGANCPVGFTVKRTDTGTMLQTGQVTAHVRRSYRVSLDGAATKHIAQARVTLFGTFGHRMMPLGGSDSGTTTETYTLSSASGGRHGFDSVVFAEKITGVEWVQLDQITYADGTDWHGTDAAPCRVAPNGYMLVASGR